MNIVQSLDDLKHSSLVICLGNFDGLHLGHQQVILRVLQEARSRGSEPVCVTFDPHPLWVLRPEHDPLLLMSTGQRLHFLEHLGLQTTCVLPFNKALSQKTAYAFVKDILLAGPPVEAVIVGFNFYFGSGRKGTPEFLTTMLKENQSEAIILEPFRVEGEVVSSSRIRYLIQVGELDEAKVLLGRPVNIWGKVIPGSSRGTQLGYPTANLKTEQEILPPYGVYAVEVSWETLTYEGVMNLGYRPTFGDSKEVAFEVHLFDFSGNLYGQMLSVNVLFKLRNEHKFSSEEELKHQIDKDCSVAQQYFMRGR